MDTARIIVVYRSKFRMGDMTLRRLLMITCYMFLRSYLRSTNIISLIDSDRGGVYGLGDVIL